MTRSGLAVLPPAAPALGGLVCWRIGVDGTPAGPGQVVAVPPGPAVVTLQADATTTDICLEARLEFLVDVPCGGVTTVRVRLPLSRLG